MGIPILHFLPYSFPKSVNQGVSEVEELVCVRHPNSSLSTLFLPQTSKRGVTDSTLFLSHSFFWGKVSLPYCLALGFAAKSRALNSAAAPLSPAYCSSLAINWRP